ncbi:isopenicillin N synthase family dioxygenase [Sinorhizobium americanum]|uniref:2-oxoglutarate-dependent ethylene/succinate-forming enzyme n=1 Tax=Sinorhizobium americanum TaxID=194963 RepID=A0A1L3LTU5_9HYPH|nr:2-oxoglutarate and iron-dependent oxygenase domain-containing protein [Sinorhizobium americanum]APG93490.1 2-oxobutyrate oxidase [Sinorhizobium americanum]OAP50232.1 2-oxobutyrate oxidase [Sinorhizobium americanum]
MSIHSIPTDLPLIDIARFHAGPQERSRFIGELRQTLHRHGFFYITGHGVDPNLISDVLSTSKRFFALPLEEKLKIEMVKSPHFRGYNRAGYERTRGKQDWREQLDINTEGTPVEIGPDTPPWKRLIGPNQWPDALPELKPLLLAYQAEVTRVSIDVLKAIAVALGQPEDAFAEIYEPQPSQLLKIIRYPGRDIAETDQGVGAHKDGGFVTVLLQDSVAGLQVETEDGVWIDAPPVPGTFVVNTGELLELATNGFVRADVHGVLAPPPGAERYSVAFFLGARYNATIPVIDLPQELKSAERGITVDPLNPIFREIGQNHLKSRLRSHPDVARAHHADLLGTEQLASDSLGSAY